MNQNQTGKDIKQDFNAMANNANTSELKNKVAELVAKNGYVAFKNPDAVAQFHANSYYVNWNYTFVDGEYRFFPPKKESKLTKETEQIELYDTRNMQLSNDPQRRIAQEKMLRGEPLTLKEKIAYSGGHDKPLRKLGDYECKPDHCYRAVSRETYEIYKNKVI